MDLQVFRCIIMQKIKFEKEPFDWNIIYLHKSNSALSMYASLTVFRLKVMA